MEQIFRDRSLICGRMISATKRSPILGHNCVWNANVVTKSRGKIWFGDLNLTTEGEKLKEIANEIGEPLYVLREMDCRFETESDSIDLLIEKAVWSTNSN